MGEVEGTCTTGCMNPKHMIDCPRCGAKYHIGLIHFCPTSKWLNDGPKITFV